MKLEAVIVPHIDLQALSKCVDLTEADKFSSRPHDKLYHVAAGLFSLNPAKHWLNLTFYFELPSAVVDMMINTNYLKISFNLQDRTTEGFISGSLIDYESFVNFSMRPNQNKSLRAVANLFFNYLNTTYKLFFDQHVKHLPDGTFCIL